MREHMGLFRGKRKDTGDWIEGYYAGYGLICPNEPEDTYNATGDYCGQTPYVGFVEVDPDTIGECTGLKDKNGKLLFEGDIVEATIVRDMGGGNTVRKERGVIGYDTIGMLGLISHFCEGVPVWTDFFHELSLSGLISDYYFEIIGNIHDNPELKGGEGE